ncbi:hypothetical protein M3936_23185 [Sutcliffiella horikoshii]|uniref:hypothetical protein n=1 Tax=Sutcliffiella horikoshii TaxID=79883 RepID=UPI00203FD138|nr:hypothetical protein [Sutcliffiella horikoshii]MCM3620463.1 hypothetical protein [Sutcliffiella horikoshii]
MPKQILDYQYIDGELSPHYYILQLYPNEINWDKNVFYFDLCPPIYSQEYSELNETLLGCSVTITDLIVNKEFPSRLGINLRSLKRRLLPDIDELSFIQQFIIYAPDLDFIIARLPEEHTKTFYLQSCK